MSGSRSLTAEQRTLLMGLKVVHSWRIACEKIADMCSVSSCASRTPSEVNQATARQRSSERLKGDVLPDFGTI